MATIRQLSGNRIVVSGMLPNGRQLRKTFSEKRMGKEFRALARQQYDELIIENREYFSGPNVRKSRNMTQYTVRELAERYVDEHLSNSRSYGNRSYLEAIIARWGEWRLIHVAIGVVRPWIRSYLTGSIKQPNGKLYSAEYAKKLVRYFQRLFNWGCEVEIIDRNPLEYLIDHAMKKDFARRIRARKQTITDEQFKEILAVSPLWLQRVCIHAWHTGMRQGEIANLKWSAVRGDLVELNAEDTKEADEKTVVIDGAVLDQMAAIRIEQEVSGLPEYVYLKDDGTRVTPIQISDGWRRARLRAGLESTGIRFHDIRRTFIDRARRAGISRWALARQVGHHAVETTERSYQSTATVEELRRIAIFSNNETAPPRG